MGLQKSKEAESQIPPFTPELFQSKSRLTPPQAKAKDKLKLKSKDIHSILFYLWNEQGIISHNKLTDDMKRAIDGVLKDYTDEEIKQAMQNYALIVKGTEYFWTHKWTLKDFLKRDGVPKFLDIEVAKQNYLKDKGGQGGAHRQSVRKLTQRDSYTRPENY